MSKNTHNLRESIETILYKSIDSSPELVSRFFKTSPSDYAEFEQFLGITTPTLRKIAKQYIGLPLAVIEKLLQSKFNEERLFALIILVSQYKKMDSLAKEDIYQFYLNNINQINNWNLVDISAHHIIGCHLWSRDRSVLLKLAQSSSMWKKRISIVATWYFIKRQDFKYTINIVSMLMTDKHDLIHKACGWMLREVGKQNIGTLKKFLNLYKTQMPRTMLRYAIEKFPKPIRKQYLLSN
jgi:3-methyladenine DNA glycosylase AlkD